MRNFESNRGFLLRNSIELILKTWGKNNFDVFYTNYYWAVICYSICVTNVSYERKIIVLSFPVISFVILIFVFQIFEIKSGFPFYWLTLYTDKTLQLFFLNIWICEWASELRNMSHFHILKLLFPSIFCWHFRNIFIFRSQITSAYIIHNQCIFLLSLMVWCYIGPTKHIEKVYVYASEASELRNFSHFRILKALFPSIFCWYFRNILNFRCQITSAYINAVSLYYLWYGAIYKRLQYTDKILTLMKCVCMRASLENFGIFTFVNCYLFQYFVGTSTSDTLSVQITCLSAYIYRQISKCTDKTSKRH